MVGISMGAALLGSAVIGAGASAIGASKNSKAIKQSTAAQQQGNTQAIAAQQQARQENLALQSPIYNAGLPAMGARNALLGLGGGQSLPTQQPLQAQPFNALGRVSGKWGGGFGMELGGGAQMLGNPMGQAPQGGVTTMASANDGFRQYIANSDYAFQRDRGINALNSGWAGAGTLQSGAAIEDSIRFGKNLDAGYRGEYMGLLGEQQQLAYGAANAMSGVNTNYANNAGDLAIANGQNLAESARLRANNSNALLTAVGTAGNNILGGLSYQGFGGGGGNYVPPSGIMPITGAYARAF